MDSSKPTSSSSQETEFVDNIIISMLQKCKLEANYNLLQIPLEDYEERVSYYTGIPKTKLDEIQKKNTPVKYPKPDTIDFSLHLIILNFLYKMYERKELPTFRLLFKNVCELKQSGLTFSKFKQSISLLGLDYQTVFNDKKLFMEDPKITFERYAYLKKIKHLRSKTNALVYYVNIRLIDKERNFNSLWQQNIQESKISTDVCVFIHAVSREGLTHGLFCCSPTEADFCKWLMDILIGSLKPSSIVVLDNILTYGTSRSKPISMFDTKNDMLQWLRNRNIPCSDALNKSELYYLVKNTTIIEESPRADNIIKANGHEVLRLPKFFEDLSPVELIWQDIKKTLACQTTVHPNNIREEILELFARIPNKTYNSYESCIQEREKCLIEIDVDTVLDEILIDLKKSTNKE